MSQPVALDSKKSPLIKNELLQLTIRRYMRNIPGMIGLVGLTILTLVVVGGPMIIEPDLALRPQPLQVLQTPSNDHLLGTDEVGRDIFARLIYAGRVSMVISFPAMLISVIIGTLFGISSGFFGGIVDQILMRIMDAILSLPSIFVLLIVGAVVRPSIPIIIAVLGFLNWVDIARILRSQVLSVRNRDFVEAARALGASQSRIILHHILPNVFSLILVAAPLVVARNILAESALSFLGLGIQPPTPTWGNMLNQAQQHLLTHPVLAIAPGLMIMITVVLVNFVGDGLRDAFDPELVL